MTSQDAKKMGSLSDLSSVSSVLRNEGYNVNVNRLGPLNYNIQHGKRIIPRGYYIHVDFPEVSESDIRAMERIFSDNGGPDGYNNILMFDVVGSRIVYTLLYTS